MRVEKSLMLAAPRDGYDKFPFARGSIQEEDQAPWQ
jgi:hypothetical protein